MVSSEWWVGHETYDDISHVPSYVQKATERASLQYFCFKKYIHVIQIKNFLELF